MKHSELATGRVFVLRLEDGEILHEAVDRFCSEHGVFRASVSLTGAVDRDSILVSGPTVPLGTRVSPETIVLDAPCEVTGTGTVFPDDDGTPISHLHGAVGRKGFSATGDLCHGVKAWLVMEIVITELVGDGPVRRCCDPRIDGKLLEMDRWHPKRFLERPFTMRTGSRSRSSGTFRARSPPRSSSSS